MAGRSGRRVGQAPAVLLRSSESFNRYLLAFVCSAPISSWTMVGQISEYYLGRSSNRLPRRTAPDSYGFNKFAGNDPFDPQRVPIAPLSSSFLRLSLPGDRSHRRT